LGRVWAWGAGGYGALGDGTFSDRSTPFVVPGLPRITAITAGNAISIAVAADGAVWAWGDNESGQLGDSRFDIQPSPTRLTNLDGLTEFSVGNQHVMARGPGNGVRGWGRNGYGQLGTGDSIDRAVPTAVNGLPQILQLAAGFTHGVAVASDGNVWAWGSNGGGELADGTAAVVNVPADIQGLANITTLAAGAIHSLALGADGSVWGWGANNAFELGDNTRRDALVPKQILGLPAMAAVAAGYSTSFAIDRTGTVWSWGDDGTEGRLGRRDASGVPPRRRPLPITTLSGVSGISTSAYHTLALTSDGSVWSWGMNLFGQLGDGTTFDRGAPVRVNGLSNIIAVAAGNFHSLALDRNGNVWAWGYNPTGSLGDGTTTDRLAPVRVVGLSNVAAISAGEHYSCAFTADGRLWSWGWNAAGQLGTGSSLSAVSTAAGVADPAGFQSVSCGAAATVAMRSDGTVWTWGRNFEGQLGDGTFAARNQPALAVNQTLTGVLDLNPQIANSIPPGRTPPFLARAIRAGDLSRFSLSVDIKGITGTGAFASSTGRFAAAYNVYVAAGVSLGGTPIYLQLDSRNNWSALQWPMAEFLRGVALDSQNNTVTAQILQNIDLSSPLLPGTSIIVGYGTDPDEMLRSGRIRIIFTVPQP
jgi:alpha-tubulin suppressor-like RCC1 family protein